MVETGISQILRTRASGRSFLTLQHNRSRIRVVHRSSSPSSHTAQQNRSAPPSGKIVRRPYASPPGPHVSCPTTSWERGFFHRVPSWHISLPAFGRNRSPTSVKAVSGICRIKDLLVRGVFTDHGCCCHDDLRLSFAINIVDLISSSGKSSRRSIRLLTIPGVYVLPPLQLLVYMFS